MRILRSLCPVVMAAALLGIAAESAHAQTTWPSASDCQAGADSLTAGVPRIETWQFVSTAACGATGVTAIATAIRNLSLRSVSDTNYLSDLLSLASVVREMTVLTEAIALAEAKSAPLAARAFGLMVMLTQHKPRTDLKGSLGWNVLLTVPRGEDCEYGSTPHGGYDQDLPMPPDFRQRIAASADRIADDPADNRVIRDLATCLRLLLVNDVPRAVAPNLIQLEHVCGTVFRVLNSASKAARLRYEVEGTNEAGDVVVHPGASVEFITEKKGTVRLLQNGVLIRSVANAGTECS